MGKKEVVEGGLGSGEAMGESGRGLETGTGKKLRVAGNQERRK